MGYDHNYILPLGYCRHCHCPSNYCAQLAFGETCQRQTEHVIYNVRGGTSEMDNVDVLQKFEETYTEVVHNKSMENHILLGYEYDQKALMAVPCCVRRASQKRLLVELRIQEE